MTNMVKSYVRELPVGHFVPFYFCFRSVMLYAAYMGHSDYNGGQYNILHLVAQLSKVIDWCNSKDLRWAFTTSNAGAKYFDDYADIKYLDKINWTAVNERNWGGEGVPKRLKREKQAEFLVERSLPWEFICDVVSYSENVAADVSHIIENAGYKTAVKALPDWYY